MSKRHGFSHAVFCFIRFPAGTKSARLQNGFSVFFFCCARRRIHLSPKYSSPSRNTPVCKRPSPAFIPSSQSPPCRTFSGHSTAYSKCIMESFRSMNEKRVLGCYTEYPLCYATASDKSRDRTIGAHSFEHLSDRAALFSIPYRGFLYFPFAEQENGMPSPALFILRGPLFSAKRDKTSRRTQSKNRQCGKYTENTVPVAGLSASPFTATRIIAGMSVPSTEPVIS